MLEERRSTHCLELEIGVKDLVMDTGMAAVTQVQLVDSEAGLAAEPADSAMATAILDSAAADMAAEADLPSLLSCSSS